MTSVIQIFAPPEPVRLHEVEHVSSLISTGNYSNSVGGFESTLYGAFIDIMIPMLDSTEL